MARGYENDTGGDAYGTHNDDRQGDVHSAFGLMSLDDPNVIAGLSIDGQPFFSDPAAAHNQDLSTPMPMKRPQSGLLHLPALDAGGSGGRARRTRGSCARCGSSTCARRSPAWGDVAISQSASPVKARSLEVRAAAAAPACRVAAELEDADCRARGCIMRSSQRAPGQPPRRCGGQGGANVVMRTTLHGNEEDLRSYEAAVLARKAPTNLNLQVRRPAKGRGGKASSARSRDRADFLFVGSFVETSSAHAQSSTMSHSSSNSSLATPSECTRSSRWGLRPLAGSLCRGAQEGREREPRGAVVARVVGVRRGRGAVLGPRVDAAVVQAPAVADPGPCQRQADVPGLWGRRRARVGLGPGLGPDVSSGGTATDANTNPGPTVKSNAGHPFGMSHPDRIVASLAERRRRRMSAPSVGYMPLEPGAGLGLDLDKDQNQQQQGQREPQKTQGQEKGQGQGERDFPAVGYAPGPQ
ncbi:hypothetical protein BJ912DRAFT_924589 [Pholiota molesta]|nr:hypothetical protein BJ912DRAFT_924589 [Pholiota molesta]